MPNNIRRSSFSYKNAMTDTALAHIRACDAKRRSKTKIATTKKAFELALGNYIDSKMVECGLNLSALPKEAN